MAQPPQDHRAAGQHAGQVGRCASRSEAEPHTPTSTALLKQADDAVHLLLDLGPTPERYELLGSIERRRASAEARVR